MKHSCYFIICFEWSWALLYTFILLLGLTINRRPSPYCCFIACFRISKKRNIKRSPNGMKPLGKLFLEREQSRRLGVYVREATRKARGRGARPHPRGPLVAPLTDFFCLYISIYPKNIGEQNRSGVTPPQASTATKNQSGPCSGTLPEGDPSPVAIFIIPALSRTRRE